MFHFPFVMSVPKISFGSNIAGRILLLTDRHSSVICCCHNSPLYSRMPYLLPYRIFLLVRYLTTQSTVSIFLSSLCCNEKQNSFARCNYNSLCKTLRQHTVSCRVASPRHCHHRFHCTYSRLERSCSRTTPFFYTARSISLLLSLVDRKL